MPNHASPTDHIVELRDLSRHFFRADNAAVDGLSLTVYRGEILALLGPSGCGKTTTLRLIAGFERPDSGTIRIGEALVAGPRQWQPPEKRGLGVVFQEYALFPHQTVRQDVAFGLHRSPGHERAARVEEVLALVGLADFGERYPHELSGGQQQRVALARALAPRPVVVLLDEPFSNLDAELRYQMRAELKRILHDSDSTAIFVTHDQEEAMAIGDRIAIMNQGQLEQVDTPDRVFHMPASRFVAEFLGIADFIPAVTSGRGLETELGLIQQPVPGALGRTLEVMVRPHDLSATLDPSGAGEVVAHEFRGAEHLYTVRMPTGMTIRTTQDHTTLLPVGSRVTVRCQPNHALTLFEGRYAVICPQECDLPGLSHPRSVVGSRRDAPLVASL